MKFSRPAPRQVIDHQGCQVVKVVVRLSRNPRVQHTAIFRLSPRYDVHSSEVTTKLVNQAILEAQRKNSAFGDSRWMLHSYNPLP